MMQRLRLCAAVLVTLAGSATALHIPSASPLGLRALAHGSNLALRGGKKEAAAPAVVVPKPGFLAHRYDKMVNEVFDAVDTNKDGKVDVDEAYQLVLTMYIQINRQAPIDPPPRPLVANLFKAADADKSGYLSKEEFCSLASTLCARAFLRVAAHKLITIIGAPLFAAYLVAKFAGEMAIYDFFAKIVPPQFHAAILNKNTARLALTIMFCVSLGNIVLKGIDFWLGYFKHGKSEKKAPESSNNQGKKK